MKILDGSQSRDDILIRFSGAAGRPHNEREDPSMTARSQLTLTVLVLLLFVATGAWFLHLHSVADRPAEVIRAESQLRWSSCSSSAGLPVTMSSVRCGELRIDDPYLGTVVMPLVVIGEHGAQRDPVIQLPGGPGQSNWLDAEGIAYQRRDWLDGEFDRDLILLEPRGTGLATPKPQCDDLHTLAQRGLSKRMDADAMARRQSQAMDQCMEELRTQAIDLRGFSTSAHLHDLQTLMDLLQESLGYQGFHLVGVSYGSRLAMQQLRRDDPRVRSTVLDGIYPPDVDALDESGEMIGHLIKRIRSICSESEHCLRRHRGQLPAVMQLAARLQKNPVTRVIRREDRDPQTIVLNGSQFLMALFVESYSNELLPMLPLMMDQFNSGDIAALDPLLWHLLVALDDDSVNSVILAAVECQDAAHFSESRWLTLRERYPEFSMALGSFFDETLCQRMGLESASEQGVQAVHSDVPSLLFSSSGDVVTPARWGDRAASSLTRSRHIVLPDTPHGAALYEPCVRNLVREFWNSLDPAATLQCEAEWQRPVAIDNPEYLVDFRSYMAEDYGIIDRERKTKLD